MNEAVSLSSRRRISSTRSLKELRSGALSCALVSFIKASLFHPISEVSKLAPIRPMIILRSNSEVFALFDFFSQ